MTRHRPGTAVLAKGRERNAAILDAATRILIADGHAGLSTRKIAAAAGIRPGHLQYYYPTKQDVIRGLLERYLERATAGLTERLAAAGATPIERLDAFVDEVLHAQANAETARFFWELWALAARDGDVADAMQGFYRAYWRTLVTTFLAVEPALGRPRAERRAALVIAMLEGLSLFRTRGAARELPLPHLERELRTLVRRLATEPA